MEVALFVGSVLVLQDVSKTKIESGKLFSSAQMRRIVAEVHLV
jgi:hypothetical protein